MGRNQGSCEIPNLEVKIPTFFRCPISLDVMRSPVSLCTGVTYDRASIQKWIDSGNNTCPATMQSLPSTDLIPNLTLRRLINLWSATAAAQRRLAGDLLQDLRSSSDPVPVLHKLADFFLDSGIDAVEKNGVIAAGDCAPAVSSVVVKNPGEIEIIEAAVGVIAVIVTADWIEEKNKGIVASYLISDLNASVPPILSVLKEGKMLESRIHAARVLSAVLSSSDPDSKSSIVDSPNIIPDLIRLIVDETDPSAIDAGLQCLAAIAGVRRARLRLVEEGVVPAAVKVLTADASPAPAPAMEKALRLLQGASSIAEGRSAICASPECLGAVVEGMMKVGREGKEAAMAVLWSVCCRFRDRRAVEAVTAASGGVMKILLVMQSNCSPAVRQMAGDLLRIFRVNSGSCIVAYDTKTKHIMPF